LYAGPGRAGPRTSDISTGGAQSVQRANQVVRLRR